MLVSYTHALDPSVRRLAFVRVTSFLRHCLRSCALRRIPELLRWERLLFRLGIALAFFLRPSFRPRDSRWERFQLSQPSENSSRTKWSKSKDALKKRRSVATNLPLPVDDKRLMRAAMSANVFSERNIHRARTILGRDVSVTDSSNAIRYHIAICAI
jgi:hypothetical protein